MTESCQDCNTRGNIYRMLIEDEQAMVRHLCTQCFVEQFERRVRIGLAWFGKPDATQTIMTGVSGIDSLALTACLIALGYGSQLLCCIIREADNTHRDEELMVWREVLQGWRIRLVEKDFRAQYGESLNALVNRRREAFKDGVTPCLACALLRNHLLYRSAIEENCNVLAVGGHADDAACNQLGAHIFGRTVKAGCISYKRYFPARQQIGRLTLIRPLVLEPKENVEIYARSKTGLIMPPYICEYHQFRGTFKMQRIINDLNDAFPGVRRILTAQAIEEAPQFVDACQKCGALRDEFGSGRCAACTLMNQLGMSE